MRISISFLNNAIRSMAALMLSMSFSSISQAQESEFVAQLNFELASFDPHLVVSNSDGIVNSVVYEGLLRMRFPEVLPALAKDWTSSKNFTEWTFNLRDNAYFHNGREVNSEDVVFSFNRILSNENLAMHDVFKNKIFSVEIIDRKSVRFILTKKDEKFIQHIALGIRSAIVPPEAFDVSGKMVSPIGTGPYKMSAFNGSEGAILDLNPDFPEDLPNLAKSIEIKIENDAQTRFQNVLEGVADWGFSVPGNMVKSLKQQGLEMGSFGNGDVLRINFNHQRGVFQHSNIRKAFEGLIDREFINDTVFGGLGQPVSQPFGDESPYKLYQRIETLAKEQSFEILSSLREQERNIRIVNPSGYHDDFWPILIPQLEEAGFSIEYVNVSAQQAYSELLDLNYDIVLMNQSHPYSWERAFGYFTPDSNGNLWVGGYSNPKVNEILNLASSLTSEQEKREPYQALFDELQGDTAVIYLATLPFTHAWRKGDITAASTGAILLRHADP